MISELIIVLCYINILVNSFSRFWHALSDIQVESQKETIAFNYTYMHHKAILIFKGNHTRSCFIPLILIIIYLGVITRSRRYCGLSGLNAKNLSPFRR